MEDPSTLNTENPSPPYPRLQKSTQKIRNKMKHDTIRIVLIGPSGSGKTYLRANLMALIEEGPIIVPSTVGNQIAHGTPYIMEFDYTSKGDNPFTLRIKDTRGIDMDLRSIEEYSDKLVHLYEGILPKEFINVPGGATELLNNTTITTERQHVICFVIPMNSKSWTMYMNSVSSMCKGLAEKGYPFLLILTHHDKVSDNERESYKNQIAESIGKPADAFVFTVENELKNGATLEEGPKKELLLNLLDRIVDLSNEVTPKEYRNLTKLGMMRLKENSEVAMNTVRTIPVPHMSCQGIIIALLVLIVAFLVALNFFKGK